jgi:Pectate lyase superfamily protein
MRSRTMVALPLLMLMLSPFSQAQLWKPILSPGQAIDWSSAGVGGIPARNTKCAIVFPPATFTEINTALASCPGGDAVYLAAGTYSITGTIRVPSNVTLRGAGASLTILNATGGSGGDVISLGSGSASYNPVGIRRGKTAGSSSIEVGNASDISLGRLLVIAEMNVGGRVPAQRSEKDSSWCDGGMAGTRGLERGQIVAVTGVNGTRVTISPGLYSTYRNTSVAIPFSMSEAYAGVEDLQVYANNSGYAANFGISKCAYCWIKGVESSDTGGDHVEVDWGYHDEVRDSFFLGDVPPAPGTHDSDIHIALNTTASLVENNIVVLGSLTLGSGAAGNVVSYNYWAGESDSDSTDAAIGGIDLRGEHLQFNLLEGNVLSTMYSDPVSFASGRTTAYRNWMIGGRLICGSIGGHDTVNCMDPKSRYGIQATRTAENLHPEAGPNLVGNVVGIAQRQFPVDSSSLLVEKASAEYPHRRDDDAGVDGSSSDYLELRDDGANIQAKGVGQTLPATFYLSCKPSWWRSVPFPATGPDVTGGLGPEGHSYGNPAQACYFRVMGGSDEAVGRPLTFDAGRCYGTGRPAPKAPTGLTANAHRAGP